MKYLLDTNTCVYFLNGNESLKMKFGEIGVYSLSISNGVLAELYFGAYRSKKVEENVNYLQWVSRKSFNIGRLTHRLT